MRSKWQCSESSFITLVKLMLKMDELESMKDSFKIVRIKNKLDSKDSNILINYLYMGKVLCELQLSVQELKNKDKHYYNFSHFIY